MSKIENHKFTIEEAFNDCFYIVPDYQREYVWSDKEVNKLLDDLNNEIESGSASEYFIGTILVSPTQHKKQYDVIDGQQRLTTFFLMLCALKALFKGEPQEAILSNLISTSFTDSDGEISTSLKLNPKYENAEEVITAIIKSGNQPETIKALLNAAGVSQFGALENIINAYTTIYQYLKYNYQETGTLKKYWGNLSNNVVFIQISTDVSSALKIFETINERGVGLNPMDLLKNLLFTNVKLDEFTKLKNEWKKITNPLEENKEKPLRFLRYFLMANYTISNHRSDGIVREDEIYDWFSKKENITASNYQKEPFVFVRKIIKTVSNFLLLTKGKGNDGEDNVYMNNIRKLTGGGFSLHYVILLASYNLPKDLFDHLLKQLETFLFYFMVTRTSTKILERNFSDWADELRAISNSTDYATQKVQLNEFISNRFEKSTISKQPELIDALRRYHFYSLQQYRTRYILAKFTQHVNMAYKGLLSPDNLNDYTNLEIEHILPNTPNQELLNDFILHPDNKDKEYQQYKVKLGNLTLLEKPINIVASRDFFKNKKSQYKMSKYYLTSSLDALNNVGENTSITRINTKLKPFNDEWTAKQIDERQEMLLELAADIWKIEPLQD
ncbi:DUF262 domain-containing protein [Formosa algae]|uniref:Uncharacterized protein with ParB-like and HNH nuclease domain n=1 Tax=Formosa algae TaxID=225843 RepID=A0A9X1CAW1_9FLAO|nr:DUF262 domain-containing protein [Formosa algae]MBP1839417.1 uncharacterized protein with ParB-like and HNH nuclease domain [Formosa algae]MDQ0334721.1 uncharacterized protein with ParB-like and HNH nuclease domain [Formosa algae]OEI81973.1 hypothetical protein AST99_00570 [Formosa algae]